VNELHDDYDLVIERVRGLLELVFDQPDEVSDLTHLLVADAYDELRADPCQPFESALVQQVAPRTAIALAIEELARAMALGRDVRERLRAGLASARLAKALEAFPADA
jgi:hypothetical protein